MSKDLPIGRRLMDVAWFRDGGNIHTGEALVLACLLHVKKKRTAEQEEQLKEVLGVFEAREKKNTRRSPKNKK
jgi:hypothetical protein